MRNVIIKNRLTFGQKLLISLDFDLVYFQSVLGH